MISVHIHGSSTSPVGLARPKTRGVVLDTARMKKITVYPERGYFETGPGVHLAQLTKELACFEEHMARKITAEWYGYKYFDDSDVV